VEVGTSLESGVQAKVHKQRARMSPRAIYFLGSKTITGM